jgi:hypothetical protein
MLFVGTALIVNISWVEINCAGSNPAIGPSMLLPDKVRDFGQTSLQEQLQVSFPIHNAGNRRLVLNEFNLECDCVDRARGSILIPAGETAEVKVLLDTRFAFGQVENSIRFTTNDPAQPQIVLTVRANVAETSILNERRDSRSRH